MTEQNPAIFIGASSHPAEDVRRWMFTVTGGLEGYLETGDLAVTERAASANMSVDVAGGRAYILGTEGTYQGTYFVENRSTTNVVISASDPADPRIDLIVAKVQDAEYSGATNSWSLAVVTGTPATSPAVPTAPANSISLAQVAVAASASSIVDANITDLRTQFNPGVKFVSFTASGTFTKADYPWCKFINVKVVGAGGGSGGVDATAGTERGEAGGGGGGGYSEAWILAEDLATSETVTVGSAGAAGSTGSAGGAGGTSSFGSHASATGGSGGSAGNATTNNNVSTGGAGGSGSLGDINLPGERGGAGSTVSSGTTITMLSTNRGGASGGGIGGSAANASGNTSTTGEVGLNYGGGAAGAKNSNSQAAIAGSAGAAGVVLVEIYG